MKKPIWAAELFNECMWKNVVVTAMRYRKASGWYYPPYTSESVVAHLKSVWRNLPIKHRNDAAIDIIEKLLKLLEMRK